MKTLGVTTSGLRKAKRIHRILQLMGWRVAPANRLRRVDAIAGWGGKPTAIEARREAERRAVPFVVLEDGFLRSRGLGVAGDPPVSLIVDEDGLYSDIASRDGLEALLLSDLVAQNSLCERAERALERLRARRVTKYNHAPSAAPDPLPERFVLVVDQTEGDAAISGAGASAQSFEDMLATAVAEADGLPVLVKTHPDVLAGARESYLSRCVQGAASPGPNVRLFAADVNPWTLFERAARVYAVSSLMGYEAALAGRPVDLFGWPFYAGWGVTRDRVPAPTPLRREKRSLVQMFAATHVVYPVYYDPDRDSLSDVETIVEYLSRP